MAEYLAPGVYVEETSFRAKPIEGVATSTTSFVGMTRTGPVGQASEVLTSVGDFERVYGGLDDLQQGANTHINQLAHAVRAYFDNGGSRLYVSRVFSPSNPANPAEDFARSPNLGTTGGQFRARFPGRFGSGHVRVTETQHPTGPASLASAPLGSMVRVGANAATSASLEGTQTGPFSLQNGDALHLHVGGVDEEITFLGVPAIATAQDALGTPLNLLGASQAARTLSITVNGESQSVSLPDADGQSEASVLSELNTGLSGVSVSLQNGFLEIRTDRQGDASVTLVVEQNPTFGVSAQLAETGAGNVANLSEVSVVEVNTILQNSANLAGLVHASALLGGELRLETVGTGSAATLELRAPAAAPDARVVFGLATGPVSGIDGGVNQLYVKTGEDSWFLDGAAPNTSVPTANIAAGAVFLSLSVEARDGDGQVRTFDDLGYDPHHPRFLGAVVSMTPDRRIDQLESWVGVHGLSGATNAFDLRSGLFSGATPLSSGLGVTRVIALVGGQDGAEPSAVSWREALESLRLVEGISIVAAPGCSEVADAAAITQELLTHVSRRGAYQIAVVDTPLGSAPSKARGMRGAIDTTRAAIYYPGVVISNPLARPGNASQPREVTLVPSGFVCGMYARNDAERGVFKAPANMVVRGALRFERSLSSGEQEVLNPAGINCLRALSGRGLRLWGARLASSDPEWRYVNVRRFFNYLEASIERSTQWAVFEPNGPALWVNVAESIESFLYNEWRSGALLGNSPREAFFVRCDRSTMTQSDLDNGRLVCEIGVAVVNPAEFVIFRIGQMTSGSRK